MNPANTVLVITDKPADAQQLAHTLSTARDGPFVTEHASDLAGATRRLTKGGIDVVLADLYLPDSQGIATFDTLFKFVPPIPIMTISDDATEHLAIEAVQRGAQGYLLRGHFQSFLVPQALRNIIQRKKVEDALFIEKERARVTLDSIGDGVISTDMTGKVTYLNREAERLTGWTTAEAYGRDIADVFRLVDGDTNEPVGNPVELVIKKKERSAIQSNATLVRRDGQHCPVDDSVAPIFDATGSVTGAVITFHDISEMRAMVRKMAHLAHHDFLTGLPNRMLLNDRLSQAIAYARRHGLHACGPVPRSG